LNKFILAPELVRVKEMKQGPTKQGKDGLGELSNKPGKSKQTK